MVTKNIVGRGGSEVPAERVVAWLEDYELTDTNAATVLGVSVRTIRDWTKRGAKGAGGRYLLTLIVQNTHPYRLAAQLGLRLTSFRRSQFDRNGASAADHGAVEIGCGAQPEIKYRWPARP